MRKIDGTNKDYYDIAAEVKVEMATQNAHRNPRVVRNHGSKWVCRLLKILWNSSATNGRQFSVDKRQSLHRIHHSGKPLKQIINLHQQFEAAHFYVDIVKH